MDPSKRKWVFVNVVQCFGPNDVKGYTIIRARPPTTWELEVHNVSNNLLSRNKPKVEHYIGIGGDRYQANVIQNVDWSCTIPSTCVKSSKLPRCRARIISDWPPKECKHG